MRSRPSRQTLKSLSSTTRNDRLLYFILMIGFFFCILFVISILIGFHPPLPDSPIITRHYNNNNKYNNKYLNINDYDTIFIGMPSLNDPDCQLSLDSIYSNAYNPDRIFVGIYQQNDYKKYPDCINITLLDCDNKHKSKQHPLCTRLWQVRINRVSDLDAKGPTHGRYMSDKLYKNEKYYLITDSHTFFRPDWDKILIDLYKSINNEYAIITHYPKGDDIMEKSLNEWKNNPHNAHSYHICGTFYEVSPNHMPRNANGCYIKVKNISKPILVPFWAGGFSFSKSHLRDNVPFDPHTPYLFHGEEFHLSSRAWTFGYDFYSPPFDILFHRYADRAKRGRMPYNNDIARLRDESEKRVNALWGLLELRTPNDINKANLIDLDKYPLGNKRTLSQFWKFCGLNEITQNITVFDHDLWANGGLTRIKWNPPNIDPMDLIN